MNWEDLRTFLAVAQTRSLRQAGGRIAANHSTVSRRIAALERKLGTRLFDRRPEGYVLTVEGKEVLRSVDAIQREIESLERHMLGRDEQLSGTVRLTSPDHFIPLLAPILTNFAVEYPDIELLVQGSFTVQDIARREADVAIRGIREGSPNESLVGRKVAHYVNATYASREYLKLHDLSALPPTARWIGWGEGMKFPDWVKESDYPHIPAWGALNHALGQREMVKAGLGIGLLPCFLADPEPSLERLAPGSLYPGYDIWLLTHEDLRAAGRVRALLDFLYESLGLLRPLFEGKRAQRRR